MVEPGINESQLQTRRLTRHQTMTVISPYIIAPLHSTGSLVHSTFLPKTRRHLHPPLLYHRPTSFYSIAYHDFIRFIYLTVSVVASIRHSNPPAPQARALRTASLQHHQQPIVLSRVLLGLPLELTTGKTDSPSTSCQYGSERRWPVVQPLL
jgi:hypothetical protein